MPIAQECFKYKETPGQRADDCTCLCYRLCRLLLKSGYLQPNRTGRIMVMLGDSDCDRAADPES
ncbi:hypothetical protein [Coleofasciculus sp.]|uniref:hypothetical protein n=1 Tax=Coleofasciculus sp. TaxID=3100458 RepID=UPI003A4501FB